MNDLWHMGRIQFVGLVQSIENEWTLRTLIISVFCFLGIIVQHEANEHGYILNLPPADLLSTVNVNHTYSLTILFTD